MTLRFLFSLFLILITVGLHAQQEEINLIPNPGFEDQNICAKYKELCSPAAWHSSTLKAFYYLNSKNASTAVNKAQEGDRYVSLCLYNKKRAFDRGFIQTPLLCKLEAGKTYELSFYYKAPFKIVEEIGVHFFDSLVIRKKNDPLQNIAPHIVFKNNKPIAPNQWIIAKETFKAKGGEAVLMIGNFNSDENTNVIPLNKAKKKSYDNKQSRTYILFDHFKLQAIDKIENCNLKDRKKLIYEDNIRHTIPKKRSYEPIKNTDSEVKEISKSIEAKKPEFLVIDTDSILISETFELPNILFDSNSDRLLNIAYPSLRKLANYLQFNRTIKINITGHTDNIGSTISNQSLSKRRAKAVQEYLLNQGISKTRIRYFGKGESEPLDTNDTEQGKAKNRRVEFSLIKS